MTLRDLTPWEIEYSYPGPFPCADCERIDTLKRLRVESRRSPGRPREEARLSDLIRSLSHTHTEDR